MPGLQSLVSAWVKVNQGHVEYFSDNQLSSAPGVATDALSPYLPTSHPTQPSHGSAQGQTGTAPVHQDPSSLSSYSLPSHKALQSGATNETNRTDMTPFGTPNALPIRLRSQRSHQSIHGQPHVSFQPSHDVYTRLPRPSRRSYHHHSNLANYNNSSHSKGHHSSVDFASSINFDSFPPPQAGADAILCRRKSVDSSLGEPTTASTSAVTASSSTTPSHSSNRKSLLLINDPDKLASYSGDIVDGSTAPSDRANKNNMINLNAVHSGLTESSLNHCRVNATSPNVEVNSPSNTTDGINPTENANPGIQSLSRSGPRVLRKHHRQKLRRSHSRTDLVREMALDRNNARSANGLSALTGPGAGLVASANNLSGTAVNDTTELSPLSPTPIGFTSLSLLSMPSMETQSSSSLTVQPSARLTLSTNSSSSLPVTEEEAVDHGQTPGVGASGSTKNIGDLIAHTNVTSTIMAATVNSTTGSLNKSFNSSASSTTPISSGAHWMQGFLVNHSSSRTSPAPRYPSSTDGSLRPTNKGSNTATNTTKKQDSANEKQTINNSTGINSPTLASYPKCHRCDQMEATLLALQADLEYLRTLELQREFTCRECDSASANRRRQSQSQQRQSQPNLTDPSLPPTYQNSLYPNVSSGQSVSSAVSAGSRGSRSSRFRRKRSGGSSNFGPLNSNVHTHNSGSRTALLLRDASKRLSELSTRHKRQVKQTTHDRAYWQNDMHLKLEKFAMMCKNLNEEAAKRSNEAKESRMMLEKITSERNALTTQMETLKARVALYEEESVEHARLREKWERDERKMLDLRDKAIKDRDVIIKDLSSRLGLAIETIEIERKQQRLRRQIIFPTSRSSSLQSARDNGTNRNASNHTLNNPGEAAGTNVSQHHRSSLPTEPAKDDLERIQKSKEMARKAQMSLQVAMIQSAMKERDLKNRLTLMEQELSEAWMVAHSKCLKKPLDLDEILESRLSLRRVRSASSL